MASSTLIKLAPGESGVNISRHALVQVRVIHERCLMYGFGCPITVSCFGAIKHVTLNIFASNACLCKCLDRCLLIFKIDTPETVWSEWSVLLL